MQSNMGLSSRIKSEAYNLRNVKIGGGGFVPGIITHHGEKGLMYCRTDVGGAYGSEDRGASWTPLMDWIGMSEVNLTGVESIAIDPGDPRVVYIACGTYLRCGNGTIFRSRDRGRTFERFDVPFAMGANEPGRGSGERLACDPNDGRILFFGSRNAGLWKSGDSGVTWNVVEGFPRIKGGTIPPDREDSPQNATAAQYGKTGITCVLFDASSGKRGSPTPVIYVSVSVAGVSVYRSADCGATWEAVAGQPLGLRPNHIVISSDKRLYISYGKEPGPNTMTDGAVWRFDTQTGFWADVTPHKPSAEHPFGYGGVSVDASDPAVIAASTFCRYSLGDEVFRSTDGGNTWRPLLAGAKLVYDNAPWTKNTFVHWMSDIEIDPFDSNHIMVTTGYGMWGCINARDLKPEEAATWVFQAKGIEETVALGLVSPEKGPHLLSAIGDYDGFRHDDLEVSPVEGQYASPPRYSNSESIAIASRKQNIVVRFGQSREKVINGAFSLDCGTTWKTFATLPEEEKCFGPVAVSADGKSIVLSIKKRLSYVTYDYGATWSKCEGIPEGIRTVADPFNPRTFYCLDSRSGILYVSSDSGASFGVLCEKLPAASDYGPGFGGDGGPGGLLYASPSIDGELWIAMRESGMLKSRDKGRSFERVENISKAYSLGFGKAAHGSSSPALFLSGKIGDIKGLFRSDDCASTWIRINDDSHQYGWINHVTGDMRIFGRVYFGTCGRGIIYGDIKA